MFSCYLTQPLVAVNYTETTIPCLTLSANLASLARTSRFQGAGQQPWSCSQMPEHLGRELEERGAGQVATRPHCPRLHRGPGGPGQRQLRPIPLHPGTATGLPAEVTCEGVGVDRLQSLQLVPLLLAVICHRGPRCCPWIAQTPRRRVAARTTAAPEERAAAWRAQAQRPRLGGQGPRARPGWSSNSPAPASSSS